MSVGQKQERSLDLADGRRGQIFHRYTGRVGPFTYNPKWISINKPNGVYSSGRSSTSGKGAHSYLSLLTSNALAYRVRFFFQNGSPRFCRYIMGSERRGGAQRGGKRRNTEIPFLALHTILLTVMRTSFPNRGRLRFLFRLPNAIWQQ